ncbi:hypothetical protein [Labrys monachus]|uniref:Uncharacterized protein n=1 Tax=Labrys monachus TaxID=217067 RepID=A0ABU0FDU6_9HYPH|nr:hypothetical protein [Labrys monachus]MDQ0392779.1 hypothetical protein [Labrys monachus]
MNITGGTQASAVIPAEAKRKAGTHNRNFAKLVLMGSGLALRAPRNDAFERSFRTHLIPEFHRAQPSCPMEIAILPYWLA